MRIPKRELRYFLGEGYEKLLLPELIRRLKKKGIGVNGKMTIFEMFALVREAYGKETKN